MKNIPKLFGNLNRARSAKVPLLIIALVAIIGFSMVSCEDDPYYGDGYYGGGGGSSLTGTYYLSGYGSAWITFRSNYSYTSSGTSSGSYTFNGSYIFLTTGYVAGVDEFYYHQSYLTDEDGRTWYRN